MPRQAVWAHGAHIMDGGNNMNPMQSFMQGAQYGTHLRQQNQANEVNSLASLGKLHDARTKATEYGMSGRANDLAAQISAMGETDRRQRAEVTGAIASIAGSALKLPVEQRLEYASRQAELLGLNPDIVGKVGSWDDASMQAIQFNALDAQKQLSHGLAVDKQNAAIADTQADNARADNALTQAQSQFDVTTELKRENQQSLIADRDADNRREDMKAQQAQRQFSESLALKKETAAKGPQLTPYQQETLQMKRDKVAKEDAKAAEARETAKAGKSNMLSLVKRLSSGDLKGGFMESYAASGKFSPRNYWPGTDVNTAKGVLNQVISELTLDRVSNFKGAVSDKDLEVAMGAATRLKNRNISDEEALNAIKELELVFGGGELADPLGIR